MNKLTARIIGNALTGFATGFVSVTAIDGISFNGFVIGCFAGFLQVCITCGTELKSYGAPSANPGTKTKKILTVF